MPQVLARKTAGGRHRLLGAVGALAIMLSSVAVAQSLAPTWQMAAGGKQTFEVASVRQNKSGDQGGINVSIGPGDDSPPAGNLYSGKNVPLISYIYFAYKLTGSQLQSLIPHLPRWVITDHFDVQARAEGTPTKDQMRLMMQSLLADRFKLAMHYETQEGPVFALVLAKPGKLGPHLRPHPAGSSCSIPVSPGAQPGIASTTVDGGFPTACGGVVGMPSPAPALMRAGARNVPIGMLATTLAAMGNLDRPVMDQTGLKGTYDFTLEWAPPGLAQMSKGQGSGRQDADNPLPTESSGPSITVALQEQLGLKLGPQEGPVEIFVVDHVEPPSEN